MSRSSAAASSGVESGGTYIVSDARAGRSGAKSEPALAAKQTF